MAGLRNEFHFPSFDMLPDYSPWDGRYDKPVGNHMVTRAHWCFLAEIVELGNFIRPRAYVRTHTGERLIVHFHHEQHEQPTTFRWADMRPGRCLALQYAYRKQMMDFSEGIRFHCLDRVFVFRAPLEKLLGVNDKIFAGVCFLEGCEANRAQGEGAAALMRCARCKLARYCCKVKYWLQCPSFVTRQTEFIT